MPKDLKEIGRARAGRLARLARFIVLMGATSLSAAVSPANATSTLVPKVSGLPWGSGVNGPSSENAAFAAWRGGRQLDVRTIFFGLSNWQHMAASANGFSSKIQGGPGRLVAAIGMLPNPQRGQLAQCAAGQFDPQIRAVATNMLNNGAQAAANAGKPVIVRLGWEANNEESFAWAATGDGSTWRNCFKRWVNILNPVVSGKRQKRFLIVWNMANRGTITYPIDNLWPGGEYVDIVGSQYYDRCPPLPEGDKYAFEARLDARTHANNPAGPRAWLEYAKSKGKPYAMPEWGIGGPRHTCAEPGTDNPYFIRKMYEFFHKNAAHIAFEAYFNATGGGPAAKGTHQIYVPGHGYNPRSAAKYRELWSAGRPPAAEPAPEKPEPPAPPPASDTLYWLRYVASYPDLIETVGANPARAHASWVATGRAQKRTAYFSPQGYMQRQPAIGRLVGHNAIAATKHYINEGFARGVYTWSEGPQHWLKYIASHQVLIDRLGTQASAGELHYHNTGKWEGRTVTFDALAYLRSNAAARSLCGARDQTCATKHYINTH